MVDVAAIFDEVFGPDDPAQGLSEKRCVRCVGVSGGVKSLENDNISNTPDLTQKHTLRKGVSEAGERRVRDVVENQNVTAKDTPTHQTHLKMETPAEAVDINSFQERAAIREHDGEQPRREAETRAAQELGFTDVHDLHGATVSRWAAEIDRLAELRAVDPKGAETLRRAQAFIREGWALQAARLGWDECQLFGVCPHAPWQRLDRKGAAFGGAVRTVTQEAVTYACGLRRYRATVNNDGGAVPVWQLVDKEAR